MKTKLKKKLFDKIEKKAEKEKSTVWSGQRGTYVIETVEKRRDSDMIQRVYLNRKYFSGMFTTKDSLTFSGDTKRESEKVYLLFRLKAPDRMEIYEKL